MTPARKEPDLQRYSGRLAHRLRILREKANITVPEMAEMIGVADRTYYGWESGKSEISADFYPFIAEALGKKSVHSIMPKK